MRSGALQWLICPLCRADLKVENIREPDTSHKDEDVEEGTLTCEGGHAFVVARGVPRLLVDTAGTQASKSVRESFSREWEHYDYGAADRTWSQDVDDRLRDFLQFLDTSAEELAGKVVLDAGCGNGVLSAAVSRSFGCEVVAADLSRSVESARRHLGRMPGVNAHYVQADLGAPPFRPGSFDVVFCAGVLHHTPNTHEAFMGLLPSVAEGGRIFVWLYHHLPGARMRVRMALRRLIAPLPAGPKRAIVVGVILPPAMGRQYVQVALGRSSPSDRLKWRERLVVLLDSYTPRYRWEHTPEEVQEWFARAGFANSRTTERGPFGFGVLAERPQRALP